MSNDPTVRESVSFILVVTLGGVCYVLATLVARGLFPRHVYWGRLILLSLLLVRRTFHSLAAPVSAGDW